MLSSTYNALINGPIHYLHTITIVVIVFICQAILQALNEWPDLDFCIVNNTHTAGGAGLSNGHSSTSH